MNLEILTCAIVGHLVGDYLLQNDWMALNKKKRGFPCAVHCSLWTLSVCFFAGWPLLTKHTIIHAPDHRHWIWFLHWKPMVLFVTHFIQDRTEIVRFWMTRINRQQKFTEPPMAPWSLIVVDNVWHIVTLWAICRFMV